MAVLTYLKKPVPSTNPKDLEHTLFITPVRLHETRVIWQLLEASKQQGKRAVSGTFQQARSNNQNVYTLFSLLPPATIKWDE